jgi:hypothetical protein
MYHVAQIRFDDLNWQTRRYSAMAAYAESKLANVLFVRDPVAAGRLWGVSAELTDCDWP